MDQTILPQPIRKYQGGLDSLTYVWQPVLKENL